MLIIKKTLDVPYSTEKMYELVNDIESYAIFLPWCKQSTILCQESNLITAKLVLGTKRLNYSFVTRNLLTPPYSIQLELQEGPLHYLEGSWNFEPTETGGSKISLDLKFEVSNKVLNLLLPVSVIDRVGDELVQAFVSRAEHLYAITSKNGLSS